MLYQPVSKWHSLHFELLIELVAQKLTELWRFKNLAYFLTWWPSSMTYLFVNVTYWNSLPIPYVDQVWWWYVKAFMSYAWQNWQTNRQTDRQTDKRTYLPKCKFWQVTNKQKMKGQSEIAYLPKFADLYVKLKLEFLIASPISYIWAFDRFFSSKLLQFKVFTYFRTLWRHQQSNPRSFVNAYSQLNYTYVH